MNGKKARELRNIVRNSAEHLPVVNYVDTPHQKMLPVGFTSDGKLKYEVFTLFQRRLEDCQRHLYQKAKVYHHFFYGR